MIRHLKIFFLPAQLQGWYPFMHACVGMCACMQCSYVVVGKENYWASEASSS